METKKVSTSTELDVSNASRGVWLVKVPKYISSTWEKAQPLSEIGRLKIKKGQAGKPEILFDLTHPTKGAASSESKIPKEHKFALNDIPGQHLAVFSHEKDEKNGNILTLEGNVMQKGECRPIGDKNYMTLKVKTIVDARKPTRLVQQLDKAVVNYKPVNAHRVDVEFEKKKKSEKKSRDDLSKVQDMIFSAFEKKPYYSLKQLHSITNQPISFLKEILREICVYNPRNSKHMWELKKEYSHYSKTEEEKS